MKKFFQILTLFLASYSVAVAQSASIARVMADKVMSDYVWAVGYGATLEEADKNAMTALASYAQQLTTTSVGVMVDHATSNGNKSSETLKMESLAVSNMYLENVKREILPDHMGQKQVLRYMTRAEWDSRYQALKSKIESYITEGKYAPFVEDKIRYYTWADILLKTYPDTEEPIKVESRGASQWLYEQLRLLLNNIKVSIISIEQDKSNRNYPYKLYVDFTYDGEPISYLRFSFSDGRGVVNEAVKDGRSVIQMSTLTPEINIYIDCVNKELARSIEPSVYLLCEAKKLPVSYIDEGCKKVSTKDENGEEIKPEKSVDTNAPEVKSEVNEKLAEAKAEQVEVKEKVVSTRPFANIMTAIVGSISKISTDDISHHFTPEAWAQYQKIVANGKPIIARTPEYKYIPHDTLTICHSLPLKLKFKGNHSFVEDVVFRVNNRTHKVESVAYKLSAKTEQAIMGMKWDDNARLTLITFLENYRTAYCLEDLDYIEKIFANDAYIIRGTMLKQSTRKFSDNPYAITTVVPKYEKMKKSEYINHLRRCFDSKEFVNVRFEECNVAKGYGAKEGIYAVQVNQLYYSDNYADKGVLTLAIDMRDEKNPLIRVRIWLNERDVTYNAEQMIERTVSVKDGLQ